MYWHDSGFTFILGEGRKRVKCQRIPSRVYYLYIADYYYSEFVQLRQFISEIKLKLENLRIGRVQSRIITKKKYNKTCTTYSVKMKQWIIKGT